MVGPISWTFRAREFSPCAVSGAARACAVHERRRRLAGTSRISSASASRASRAPRRRVSEPFCVRKAATPWARAGSGFTLLFEAYVLALAKSMPIANAAERLGEHDTRLWRIVEHYVWRAVEKLDLSLVRRIAADETSRDAATTTSAGAIQSDAITRYGGVSFLGCCHWRPRNWIGRGFSSRRPNRRLFGLSARRACARHARRATRRRAA